MVLDRIFGYEPAENEIVFLYAENTRTMFFLAEAVMREVYLVQDYEQLLKIVEILEHKIFDSVYFSGMKAFLTLENYR